MKGKLTISRVTSSHEPHNFINIEVTDENSGVTFLRVEVSMVNFAHAVTGLSCVECEFQLRPEHVGKKYEHKYEFVERPEFVLSEHNKKEAEDELLGPLEVDGWKARREDLWNHHNWVVTERLFPNSGKNKVRILFNRFVEEES